jgi:hypothetical protein
MRSQPRSSFPLRLAENFLVPFGNNQAERMYKSVKVDIRSVQRR